ncbi:MAG: hypothetical protein C5B54_10595 [Acidobacteria bacterium]|nr:MAG: hypothetical protein C5B54_10595 [Acidobacteriota bacterium]
MKRFLIPVSLFLLLLPTLLLAADTDIMPISEIKEGMTGVGRTVFKGNKIEEFQVEILGVLHNYMPQQNLILAMLKGGNLEETGVIAGMSGSPVFINGKMIGAVAYSWPFAKTPIAGITPIESMLKTQVMPTEPPSAPPLEVASGDFNFEKLITNHFQPTTAIQSATPGFGKVQLLPIASPLSISGFDQRIIDRFASIFAGFGWQVMQGGAATGSIDADGLKDADLQPGSPLSVQLITGDFDIGAIGTVTYRDADKVLAFGHPFFNLGPTNFPLATAKIYAVVPNLYSSFKLGAGGPIVGSIRQDQQAAVFGVMGSKSPMIPVTINLKDEHSSTRSFHFQVAKHNLLSPVLIDFAFQNSILVTQLGYSESTLKIHGQVHLKDGSPVQINNIFSGSGSFANASQYIASIVYALMINDFKPVEVKDVEIDVDTAMKRKEAELTEVWLDKDEVRPGEDIKLQAVYRPLQGESKREEFHVQIPNDFPYKQITFVAGGGQEISRMEFAQYGKAIQPENLDQLINLLNGLRSNDRIYVKAYSNDPSLFVKGHFLYSLPSSIFSTLSSSQTIGSSQRVNRLALFEDNHQLDYFLTGVKSFTVKVLPKQD